MRRTWERDIFDDYDEAMQAAWEAAWGQEDEDEDPYTEEEILRSLVNERLEELQATIYNLNETLETAGDLSAEEWNTLANAWQELNEILEEGL